MSADLSSITSLKRLFAKAKAAREHFSPDWYVNAAFFVGDQWRFWNRGRLDKPNLHPWRVTLVDNRVLPALTARAARKTKNRPVFTTVPYTNDEDDIAAAEIAGQVLEFDWNHLDLSRKLYSAILWSEVTGAGFWKVYWDGTKGESADFLYDGDNPLMVEGKPQRVDGATDEMKQAYESKPIGQGDVCIEVKSPFEVFPDPLATSLDDAEFLIEEIVRSPEYIEKHYGVKLEPDDVAPLGPVESRIMTSFMGGGSDAYKGVKLYELWMQPCTDYPDGWRCVWAKDKILKKEVPFDPMPYVMFNGVRAPGRFWPTSIATQLRGPQTELNKIRSQIQENAMRVGNPSLLASREANVEYTGMPGERVDFSSTVQDAVPSFLQPPEVPVYVREEVNRITEAITEISGVHEVSKASVPSGVTAASAINLLQEADDTRIAPEIQDMEIALAIAGTKNLRLRAKYNDDERLIRIAGEDGAWDIRGYRGSMLGKEPQVEVQAGSGLPRSKAAKQAAMQEILALMFQYGVKIDPRSLRKFFKDYDVGAIEGLFDRISSDEAQVQREHRQLAEGFAVPIHSWDADDYHIEAHSDFQKSARYEKLPDPVRALFESHLQAHRERTVQQVNLQLQQTGVPPGTPMPPGAARPSESNGASESPVEEPGAR